MRKKLSNWRVIRNRGNKAELVGTVPAADEKSAIKTAIKEYKIDNPEQQRRLAARPDEWPTHRKINELVQQRLKQTLRTGETINLPDWVDDFAASFADMIMQGAPEEEQLELAEYAVERLRYLIAECRHA